jgi:hypothetical protein
VSTFDRAELDRIATEAYLFFTPLVIMEITRRCQTNVTPQTHPRLAPMNHLNHSRRFPDGDFRGVVRANWDTLYSSVWLDLTDEPQVITIPPVPANRFFMFPLYDMWTEAFASPGTRTNGTAAASFAVCREGWTGALPAGVRRIDAPTPYVWIIGRTETHLAPDYPNIHAFQDGMSLTPLSAYPGPAPARECTINSSWDSRTPPFHQFRALDASDFFRWAAELAQIHPPHVSDWNMVERLKALNFHYGQPYDPDAQDASVRAALAQAPQAARRAMASFHDATSVLRNGWRYAIEGVGNWGSNYVRRAFVAIRGLGANPVEETVYPNLTLDENGRPLDGEGHYRLHFDVAPPVRAFWSLTAYNAEGFTEPNDGDRYALGDRDDLHYNDDGSLDVYLGHTCPDASPLTNWLPTPRGPIDVTLRLYWPEDAVFSGAFTPPPAERLD